MKVALAIWNGRISPVFDVSRQFLVLTIENGMIAGDNTETYFNDDPVHKASRLAELNVQTLICGAISRPFAGMLDAYNIRTISFISGEIKDVITAYIAGTLSNPVFSMPGCCERRRQIWQNRQKTLHQKFSENGKQFCQEDEIMPDNKKGSCGKGSGKGKGKGGCGGQRQQQGNCSQSGSQQQGSGSGQGKKSGSGK
jgi:predicted Fe-Mo cluster-binding NifX family protein